VCLLIDGILAIDAGALTSNLSIADQQKLKAILLTHHHYDHIRDVPAIAVNLFFNGGSVRIYSTPSVLTSIETHLLNGEIYPKYQELPESKPTINLNSIVPYKPETIEGYGILAVPVNHGNITVGYQISNAHGKAMFYTADTGPGLFECWKYVSPQLLIAEVTFSNRYAEFATNAQHLTPTFLSEELIKFRELKGYLPQVIVVHMDYTLEGEIKDELAVVAKALNASITIAYEGMQLNI
jgi:ribonuclease BN (tRNA processing enzyme)